MPRVLLWRPPDRGRLSAGLSGAGLMVPTYVPRFTRSLAAPALERAFAPYLPTFTPCAPSVDSGSNWEPACVYIPRVHVSPAPRPPGRPPAGPPLLFKYVLQYTCAHTSKWRFL